MTDIDFYSELFKGICEQDCKDDNEPKCLITHEKLETDSICLGCNHEFNYLPLLNEIKKQKSCSNHLNNIKSLEQKQKFKYEQMMCPYCRTVENNILPYNEAECVTKIIGVNWPKPTCKYIYVSGKKANNACDNSLHSKSYYNILSEIIYDANDITNNYCKQHCRIILKKQEDKDIPKCQGILKSGKRKGELCNARCTTDTTTDTTLCKRYT